MWLVGIGNSLEGREKDLWTLSTLFSKVCFILLKDNSQCNGDMGEDEAHAF